MNDGKTDLPSHNLNAVPLRHTLATLAYRGGKALRGAPPEFAEFHVGETTRTPAQILAHIGDLLDWALSLADGVHSWHDSPPLTWEQGTARFFAALAAFDQRLSSELPLACTAEGLFLRSHCRFLYARRPGRHASPHGRLPCARRELP